MIEKLIGPRRKRQLYRFLNHGKITVLCLLLTIVVLRGTIGAGKFGTPEQDFLQLRNRFVRPHPTNLLNSQHQSVLVTRSGAGGDDDADDWTGSSASSSHLPPSRLHPLRAGAMVVGYDYDRREWLRENPGFPNYYRKGKPRVLLVTGSKATPCENPVGDYYLLKAVKNKIDYCRLHGMEIMYNMAVLDAEMTGFWAKLPVIRALLVGHPEVEFVWWMDSDAMFTDMAFELPWERYEGFNLVMHGWEEMVYEEKSWVGLNTGSFFIRNCEWSLELIDVWSEMGPQGEVRVEAGKVLTKELKGRPSFEADDQSAMVYLLAKEKEKWGGKVYLENEYYLHGYWGILVDKYEEMLEKYHPGFGDHRWPLVTHFVGCKPCAKVGDYPMERCLKQMERAFNFGDNQILKMYGFSHTSLSSWRVKRLEDEKLNRQEVVGMSGMKAANVSSS